jgi:hypothetical protein
MRIHHYPCAYFIDNLLFYCRFEKIKNFMQQEAEQECPRDPRIFGLFSIPRSKASKYALRIFIKAMKYEPRNMLSKSI